MQSLPVEIGVGKHQQIDSLNVHWFDLMLNATETRVDSCVPLAMRLNFVPLLATCKPPVAMLVPSTDRSCEMPTRPRKRAA